MAVSPDQVKDIISTTEGDPVIQVMLETADVIIVEHIDPHSPSTAVRDKLQLWLAAHFLAIKDRRVQERSADGIRTQYQGVSSMGLRHTSYGQQAMVIDPTGVLSRLNSEERKRLRFYIRPDQDAARS